MKVVAITYEPGGESACRVIHVFASREGAAKAFKALLWEAERDVPWITEVYVERAGEVPKAAPSLPYVIDAPFIARWCQQVIDTGEFNCGGWCVQEVEMQP